MLGSALRNYAAGMLGTLTMVVLLGAGSLAAGSLGPSGGIGRGLADTLYCQLTGCTIVGEFTVDEGAAEDANIYIGRSTGWGTTNDGRLNLWKGVSGEAQLRWLVSGTSDTVSTARMYTTSAEHLALYTRNADFTIAAGTNEVGDIHWRFDMDGSDSGGLVFQEHNTTIATCDSSTVGNVQMYDDGAGVIGLCVCEQTAASTYAYASPTGTVTCP